MGYAQNLQPPLFTAPAMGLPYGQHLSSCHGCPGICSASPRFRNIDQVDHSHEAEKPRVLAFQRHPLMGTGIRIIGGNAVGIFVSEVNPQSPAAEAGIQAGDEILAVSSIGRCPFTQL